MKLPCAVTDKGSINNSVPLTVDWTECFCSFVNSIETFSPLLLHFVEATSVTAQETVAGERRGEEKKIKLRPEQSEECLVGSVLFRGLTGSVSCKRHCSVVSENATDALGGKSQGANGPPAVYCSTHPLISQPLHGGRTPGGGWDGRSGKMVPGRGKTPLWGVYIFPLSLKSWFIGYFSRWG